MRTRLSLLLWLPAQILLAVPAAAQPAQAAPGLVVSSGYVESKRIASGEAFPIWITFENRTGQEVLGLRVVDFRTSGLQTRGACWAPVNPASPGGPRFPSCIPDSATPAAPSPLPQRLAPGEAVTVTADLMRTERSGEFMLIGMYQWTDAKRGQHRSLIPVGPIEVTKNWEDWRTRVREDFPAVLKEVVLPLAKDLAWPLVAFFLGVLFKSSEQKRAALQQTWNQMLATSHETAKSYYMPVSAATNWFLATRRPGAVQDPDESFYYLALLFRRVRRDALGGQGVVRLEGSAEMSRLDLDLTGHVIFLFKESRLAPPPGQGSGARRRSSTSIQNRLWRLRISPVRFPS